MAIQLTFYFMYTVWERGGGKHGNAKKSKTKERKTVLKGVDDEKCTKLLV